MSSITEPKTPAESTARVDQILAARARTTGEVIAGLIATGMLHHAGSPKQLPTLAWPDLDADVVQDIWDAGAAAGYLAGRHQSRTRWDTSDLDDARQALHDAGHDALARVVTAAAYAAPSRPAPIPGTAP